MKVTTPTNLPERPTPENNRAAAKRGGAQATDMNGEDTEAVGGNSGSGRDFASVLDEVSRTDRRQESDSEGEHRDQSRSEKAEREHAAERRDERRQEGGREGGGEGGFEQRHGGIREAVAPTADAASARSILHIADLERIVSAVRTQLVAGGRREVTLELRRSVLEGLRIKLSADETGRVTAELIAASERLKSQLDARTNELSELLRSRGINLATLSTTVGGDASTGQHSADDRQTELTTQTDGASSASVEASHSSPGRENGIRDEGDETGGATYRA